MAGPWGKRLAVGAGESTAVRVAEDASARPPVLGAPSTWADFDVPVKAGLGLGDFFEVGLRLGAFSNTSMLTGKLQVVGHAARESQPGDFALAMTAGYGMGTSKNSGDQNGVLGPGGNNWSASQTTNIYDFALLIGYRLKPWLMIYGGPYFTKLNMTGTIHDDASTSSSSPAADYSLSADGQIAGANADFEFTFTEKKIFSLTVEASYQALQWTALPTATEGRLGLLCEWVF